MKINKIAVSVVSLVGLVAASAVALPGFAQVNYGGYNNASNGRSCPNMRQALNNLQQAQADLKDARTDYSGHRVAALRATNTAINEAQQALQSRDCR